MVWLSRARGLARWSRAEWALVGEAWLALGAARVALRLWPLPGVLARLRALARRRAAPAESAALARAVWRAAPLHPVPMRCLPQSLALAWMVARRGQRCELLIGARPVDGSLDAHAWVEQAGLPLNSPPDSADQHPVLVREGFG